MARKRRTAEEARKLILDTAERHLERVGPGGIRLQEVASDVGVSHPAILHHFGSREGLVDAVIERAVHNLEAQLVAAFSQAVDATKATELLNHVFEVLGNRGHARLLAWLVLSQKDSRSTDEIGADRTLSKIAGAIHALRVDARGDSAPPEEDTVFAVLLVALALFGDAIVGEVMMRSASLDDPGKSRKLFREWFGRLLVRHLEGRGV